MRLVQREGSGIDNLAEASINHFTHEYLALLQYKGGPKATAMKHEELNLVLDPQLAASSGGPIDSIPPPVTSKSINASQLSAFQRQLEVRYLRLLRRGFVV